MSRIEEKLMQLGLELPEAPPPAGAYVACVQTGKLVFVSGQIPRVKGEVRYRGHVGGDLSVEDGAKAAQICVLNALSALKSEVGSLDAIRRIVKVTGFVASAPGFHQQPKVVDGASVLLAELYGDKGMHARAAVGVNELPFGVAVELEMIVELT